jgi:hypothetical protein
MKICVIGEMTVLILSFIGPAFSLAHCVQALLLIFFPQSNMYASKPFTRSVKLIVLYAHTQEDPKFMQQYAISSIISAKQVALKTRNDFSLFSSEMKH